jgi:hypothetical protein
MGRKAGDGVKYGILMPYFNRLEQLRMTLVSFKSHYGSRLDWRAVIIVDRKESEPDRVVDVILKLGLTRRCIVLDSPTVGPSNSPCREYNLAADAADAEFILPTNPECLHLTDILSQLDVNFGRDRNCYVICACDSVTDVHMTGDDLGTLTYRHKEWFQHSIHHDRRLNFCTAMSTENYRKIGGFDVEFEAALGYADDDFLDRITTAGIRVITCDAAMSLHLEHDVTNRGERRSLVADNLLIYERKKAERLGVEA